MLNSVALEILLNAAAKEMDLAFFFFLPVGSRDPVQWGEWQAPRDVPGTRDCELIWEKALQC